MTTVFSPISPVPSAVPTAAPTQRPTAKVLAPFPGYTSLSVRFRSLAFFFSPSFFSSLLWFVFLVCLLSRSRFCFAVYLLLPGFAVLSLSVSSRATTPNRTNDLRFTTCYAKNYSESDSSFIKSVSMHRHITTQCHY